MDEMFTEDLYSMYVILQGIGSHSCIRVYIIYVITFTFGEQQPWMSEVPKTFQQKNRSPEMINFYLYCIKNMSFLSSPKGAATPYDWCRRTMIKKTSLQ